MSNDRNNWGLFAVIFAAIASVGYGVSKIAKNSQARSKELDKFSALIREGLRKGLTQDQIIQSFYADASDYFGRPLTAVEKDKIKEIFEKKAADLEKSRPK